MTPLRMISCLALLMFAGCANPMAREYREAKRIVKNAKAKPEDWTAAIAKFENVVKMKVDARQQQVALYRRLGDHYLSRSMWRDALENYQEAGRIKPGSAPVLYKEGLCLSQLYRFSPEGPEKSDLLRQAVAAYERGLEAESDHVPTLYALAILEFEFNGRPDRGLELIDRILAAQPNHIAGLYAKGRFSFEKGRYGESLEAYRKLEKLVKGSEKVRQLKSNIDTVMDRMNEGG